LIQIDFSKMSTSHAVTPLGVPVLSVDEQFFFLPPSGNLVPNRAYKLLFFYEANCRHLLVGSSDELKLESGDILVLPYWCQQLYLPYKEETSRVHALRIIFDPEIIPPRYLNRETFRLSNTTNDTANIAAYVQTHFSRMCHIKAGITAEILDTLSRLRSESEGINETGYQFRAGATCTELIVLVARQLEQSYFSNVARLRHGTFRVEEAREFIIKHLETPLRLETIAAHLQLSPEHLARVWKTTTGTTLFDFIRRSRIERAKTLLTASDANISEIGIACGFSSLALFSRTFKRETGISPSQYRERLAMS